MAPLLPCGFTQEMRGLWGAAAAPVAPLMLWGGLHEAEWEGQSEAASCRSRGRSCPWAVPAAPAAEPLDRCSSSLGSAPSGMSKTASQSLRTSAILGAMGRALWAHQHQDRGCRGLEGGIGCADPGRVPHCRGVWGLGKGRRTRNVQQPPGGASLQGQSQRWQLPREGIFGTSGSGEPSLPCRQVRAPGQAWGFSWLGESREALQGYSPGVATMQQEVPAQSQLPEYFLYWSQWHSQWRLLGVLSELWGGSVGTLVYPENSSVAFPPETRLRSFLWHSPGWHCLGL